MRCRPLLYAACLAALIPFSAQAEEELAGWGKYRFGMTIEEAKAVPGLAFEDGYSEEALPEKRLRSTNEAQIEGMPFHASLTFWTGEGHSGGWLKQVHLFWGSAHVGKAACQQKGADIQAKLETRYGPSTPRPAGGTTLIETQRNWSGKSLWTRTHWVQEGAFEGPQKCGIDLIYSGGEAPVTAPATPDTHQF